MVSGKGCPRKSCRSRKLYRYAEGPDSERFTTLLQVICETSPIPEYLARTGSVCQNVVIRGM